jgi:hypothetical protein
MLLTHISTLIEEMSASAVPIVAHYPILTDGHSKVYHSKRKQHGTVSDIITTKDFRKQRKLSRTQLGLNTS